MPYSITTKDGITLQGIPDDVPADAPELKARVATIRQQMQAGGSPDRGASNPAGGGKLAGVVMGLRDPVDAGAQMLRRLVPESVGQAVDQAGNWLADKGFPVARSNGVQGVDRIVNEVNAGYEADRTAAGRNGFDWARLAGNVVNPVNAALPSAAGARTVGQLAKVGAVAGAAGGAMQPVVGDTEDFWTKKAGQAATGAAAGAVATPVLSRAVEAGGRLFNAAVQRFRTDGPRVIGGVSRGDIDRATEQLLASQGMRLEEAPAAILNSVRRQISEAMATGRRLSPEMALRQAEAEAIGLTGDAALTAGQMSRDPLQWAREKNLSGIMFDTPNGPQNPLADRFSAQGRRLQGVFDDLGANRATDRVADGDLALSTLQAANQTADDNVRAAYSAFRNATGRDLEIPLQGLAQDYAEALRRSGDNIPGAVRSAFEGLGLMGGRQRRVLSLEDAEDIIKNVINRNDPGPVNKPVYRALGDLRAAVERAITSGADNASTGAGAEAAMLAKEARSTAAGVFQSRRDIPALQAAADDVAPDSFFQRFLLNRSAPTREVEGMAAVLRQNPEAWQQVRGQVAAYLKQAAFGKNLAGDKGVAAERFATALDAIGPQKLAVIFGPEEVVRLQIAARVAAQLESVPAGAKGALNTSGTAAGIFNLLQGLGNSPVLRNIPGARSLANQAGQIANEQAATAALRPVQAATKPPADLSPEQLRAMQRLFAPAAVAFGAASASGQ